MVGMKKKPTIKKRIKLVLSPFFLYFIAAAKQTVEHPKHKTTKMLVGIEFIILIISITYPPFFYYGVTVPIAAPITIAPITPTAVAGMRNPTATVTTVAKAVTVAAFAKSLGF